MLPYGHQSIDQQDIDAVVEVLKSDWLTTGPAVEQFETQFANHVGCKHAIAVSNGTAALHLAMLAADIGAGQRVITSPNTFVASANAAAFVGALPDFSDIDPVSYNLCPQALQANWQPDTSAVVAVDYAGQSAEMPAIAEFARSQNAVVIEDACHATGGQFEHDGNIFDIGSHPWADMTIFSFHPVKTMTTGEGGMLTTNNDEFAAKARLLRSHGITRDPNRFQGLTSATVGHSDSEIGPWYYEMHSLGYNYRITDLQCALGISQLNRLRSFIQRRQEIVEIYNELFADTEHIVTPKLRNPRDRELTSWHLYTLQIDFAAAGIQRTEIMQRLGQKGIGTQVLYIPVHLQPWYRENYGYAHGKCPVAEKFYTRSLSLPLFPTMENNDVEYVAEKVKIHLNQTATSTLVA